MEYYSLTLRDAAAGIREGRFTAEELAVSVLERVRRYEPDVLAWEWLNIDAALAQAREADQSLKSGIRPGPLHGIPIGVKDIIFTQGIPTGMGSAIFDGFVPSYSATCVQRVKSAGAFIIGKTVTTEFANQQPGKTRNPWNIEHTPGGSSSGSAAAVAARFVPGALGSQTRGSVIRPAAYCGVVGFKPSFGVVSRYGVYPLSPTLDHVGVFTRSVDDAGLMASCMIERDSRDLDTVDAGNLSKDLLAMTPLREPPRIAAVRSPCWRLVDASQRSLFEENCRTLQASGAKLDFVDLPSSFDDALDVARIIQLSEMAYNLRLLVTESKALMSARLLDALRIGSDHLAVDYLQALAKRKELQVALASVLGGYDAIVSPPATGEAPSGLAVTGDPSLCTIWTLCGVPSVVFPAGFGPSKLPLGLQVVGGYLSDAFTLCVAKWCMDQISPNGCPIPLEAS